uniref:AAA+ ATPase domain-containing protein n=1 Tax=Peronospora matthiolae TaxID=2874970 RepID=A0AAV1VK38_9STRA
MTWHARASSGDTRSALLQPHQVLLSHDDAVLQSIQPLDLLRVRFASSHSVLVLESVVDRRPSAAGAGASLRRGRIQLHLWALQVAGKVEDTRVTLEPVGVDAEVHAGALSWRLSLSLHTRFPPLAVSGSVDDSGSRAQLLPESVHKRQIDLDRAVRRQLCAARVLDAPLEGQLVPVRLLGDTYVFRIDGVEKKRELDGKLHLVVIGWSATEEVLADEQATAEVTEKVATLSMREEHSTRAAASSYERELNTRLWQTGFVGCTAFVRDVLFQLALVLKHEQRRLDTGVEMDQIGSHGLLISGVQGVGKSLALVALQRELVHEQIATWRIDGMSLLMTAEGSAFPTAYEYLVYALEQRFPRLRSLVDVETKRGSSSCVGVVLIDDLEMLFQSVDGQLADGSEMQFTSLGSALLRLIDERSLRSTRFVVVGTTASADVNIPSAAKRAGRFDKVVDLVVPTEQGRRDILQRHLVGLPLRRGADSEGNGHAASLASRLAALSGGYVAKDLVRICRYATAQVHAASTLDGDPTESSIGWSDLLRAQQHIKPSQLRELNVSSPGAHGDGKLAFAGYAAVRQQLRDFITRKFHPTAAMSRLCISEASGILLSGPSGCGKTLLVQTLAAQARVNFVSVKSSELLSKYFGDSEKAVRQLFARARAASPCLLFFDEFDSIAHKRSFSGNDGGSSGGGVYARVLSTFLNEMDGVGSQRVSVSTSHVKKSPAVESAGILVVAATNRKDALDAALIRPGRMDKTVVLGFPTQEDVAELLAVYTRKMPLATDVDIQELAARPRGSHTFTGADVASICKEAAFRALREGVEAKTVCARHFEAAWDQRAREAPDASESDSWTIKP